MSNSMYYVPTTEMFDIKHVKLTSQPLHASLSAIDTRSYQLTISDIATKTPIKQVTLFADSRRDAVRQFSSWLTRHYPRA